MTDFLQVENEKIDSNSIRNDARSAEEIFFFLIDTIKNYVV